MSFLQVARVLGGRDDSTLRVAAVAVDGGSNSVGRSTGTAPRHCTAPQIAFEPYRAWISGSAELAEALMARDPDFTFASLILYVISLSYVDRIKAGPKG